MKKTLCILLALLMLALTACQTAPADGNTDKSKEDTESKAEPQTPWSELKTWIENIDPSVQTPAALGSMMNNSEDVSGTGIFSMSIDMYGEVMESMTGNLTVDGDLSKMESTTDLMGVEIPTITWTDGETGYVQYPTLYPDNVFRAEDLAASTSAPSMDFSMDLDSVKETLITLLEENTDPDKNMTSSVSQGITTYTLKLDTTQAEALFAGFDSILEESGLSGLMSGDLLGQMGLGGEEAPETEEAHYDSAVVTVTTDKSASMNFQLCTYDAEALVETFTFDMTADDTSVTYTLENKLGEDTLLSLVMAVTPEKVTVQAELPSGESAIQLDLTLLAESETTSKLDGTISITIAQGGLSMTVPMTMNGTINADDSGMALQLNMGMELMGMSMNIAMDYSLTYSDVTLELPFGEDDILEYSEDALLEKLMEVYPDLFEDESNFYSNEDGTVSISCETENGGMMMCDGTYERSGDYITVTLFGNYTFHGHLTQSGDTYSWNGRTVDVRDIEGITNVLDIVTGAWYWSMYLYEDGTCSVTATFAVSDDGSVSLANGHTIPADQFLFLEDDTLQIYGVELYTLGAEEPLKS